MNDKIIEKYSNRKLGNKTYGENVEYVVKDFLDLSNLSHIIAETYTTESSINKDGIRFLQDYYGLDKLAIQLENNGGVEGDLISSESILKWLETLEKEAID